MRVIGGTARGRPLRAPAGRSTRPTSDRVREALFSMIGSLDTLQGSVVIDLFEGSGALGIEALSRGAACVTFVDRSRHAVAAIEANLESVGGGIRDRAIVVTADALRHAESASDADLVLCDPPYDYSDWQRLFCALRPRTRWLVAETGSDLDPVPGWETVKVRRYGGTVVTIARPVPQAAPPVRQVGKS